MVNIAVVGGTGNMGGTIAEVLKDNPKHKVIVLSRKVISIQSQSFSPSETYDKNHTGRGNC